MPNGKPGDNPVTDVVVWKRDVFGPETDGLIRQIDAFTTDRMVDDNRRPHREAPFPQPERKRRFRSAIRFAV
jgi:hypothetical protein